MILYLLLALVCFFYILFDLVTAKRGNQRRGWLRNITIGVLAVGLILSMSLGVAAMFRAADDDAKVYFNAYRYLLDEEPDSAESVIAGAEGPHSKVIRALVYFWKGNYSHAFIEVDEIQSGPSIGANLDDQVDRLHTLARRLTGLDKKTMDRETARKRIRNITEDCLALLELNEAREVEFEEGFRRDRMLRSDDYETVRLGELTDLLEESPRDEALLRYSVGYYHHRGDLEQAQVQARTLLNQNRSIENMVLYTDVVAERMRSGEHVTEANETDPEIVGLIRQAQEIEEKIDSMDEDSDRYNELKEKAKTLRDKANGVHVQRIINWLNAQAPVFGDRSGLVDFQLSKLYAVSGNEAKARELLYHLMQNASKLSDDSPIRLALEHLRGAFAADHLTDSEITSAIFSVLERDALLPKSTLKKDFATFLQKMLKYERISVVISEIDASDYPTVRVYLNVSGQTAGKRGLVNDLTPEDFILRDQGTAIPASSIRSHLDEGAQGIAIALVVDISGSMQGTAFEQSQVALHACVSNLQSNNHLLSLVAYDSSAQLVTPLTSDTAALEKGIDSLYPDGGTNIPSGIMEGIASLNGARGTKAMILLTDGQDGNRAEMERAVQTANAENIAIYTVAFGDFDRDYMQSIAKATGGRFVEAQSEEELVSIYTMLQSFIVNNYHFEYDVTEIVGDNPRLFEIELKDYRVHDARTYAHGNLTLSESGYAIPMQKDALQLVDIQPSSVSVRDLKSGVPIFFHLRGASDALKVSIDGKPVTAKRLNESTWSVVLDDRYGPGRLPVIIEDGGRRLVSREMIRIAGDQSSTTLSQTIRLGDKHHIYADRIDRLSERRLQLSGRIVLNEWIVLEGEMILDSEVAPRSDSNGWYWEQGSIYTERGLRMVVGSDAGGPDHRDPTLLPGFHGAWDKEDFFLREHPTSVTIPHLGRVSATVKMEGDVLRYQVESGALLDELTEKLNGAIYGVEFSDESLNGLVATADGIELQWSRDGVKYRGTARLKGWMGPMRIRQATVDIDSERTDLFRIRGDLSASHLPSALDLGSRIDFEIGSKGSLPDSLKMKSLHLGLDQKGISERKESEPFMSRSGIAVADLLPKALQMEPVRDWFGLYPLYFDRSELVNAQNENQNAIRLWQGADSAHAIEIRPEGTSIAVSEERERDWLGSRFGGEIRGEVLVKSSEVLVHLDIDGHLDVPALGIRFDGLSTLSVRLSPYMREDDLLTVRISNGDQIVEYRSTWKGAVHSEKKEAR